MFFAKASLDRLECTLSPFDGSRLTLLRHLLLFCWRLGEEDYASPSSNKLERVRAILGNR
jgi:hypothetical protein